MPRFLPEPDFTHDAPSRLGLLLINLGTPVAPTPDAVREYLAEFLSDPRVVEIPAVIWKPILHGYILRTRPSKSARRYASIWGKDGSPLLAHSLRQKVLLQGYLGEKLKRLGLPEDHVSIDLGMRYGEPSIAAATERLKAAHCHRILVLPLYPQYASSTTGSALDALAATGRALRRVPAMRVVDAYYDHPGYIKALAHCVNNYWTRNGRPDKLVMSFHGVPRSSLDQGDPYHCHCMKTGRLLADELGLDRTQFVVSFQSRFGRAAWLKPYTEPTVVAVAAAGVQRVDVVCPGFVSDCLETLEEIAQEVRAAFTRAGGREFHYIPCLNEEPAWIEVLASLAMDNLQGWLGPPPDTAARAATLARATALGAPR